MALRTLHRCPACGCEWPSGGPCQACWFPVTLPVPVSRDGLPYGSEGARPRRPRAKPTQPLEALLESSERPELVSFGYAACRFPWDVSLLVTGPPGGGKTTACTGMALTLAVSGLSVLWASCEEGSGPTTVERFRRVHGWLGQPPLPPGSPRISDQRTIRGIHDEVRDFEDSGGHVVVLDSLTAMSASPGWFDDLINGPLGVIAVAHQNAKGGPMGGSRVAYDADVHLVVENFEVKVRKTRWLAEGAPQVWAVDDLAPLVASSQPGPESKVVPFPKKEKSCT